MRNESYGWAVSNCGIGANVIKSYHLGIHWIYHFLTTDVGFFVSLIYSVAGLMLQLSSGFVLFFVGVAYYSPDSLKRKVGNWK